MASTSFRKQVQNCSWLFVERFEHKEGASGSQGLFTALWIKGWCHSLVSVWFNFRLVDWKITADLRADVWRCIYLSLANVSQIKSPILDLAASILQHRIILVVRYLTRLLNYWYFSQLKLPVWRD